MASLALVSCTSSGPPRANGETDVGIAGDSENAGSSGSGMASAVSNAVDDGTVDDDADGGGIKFDVGVNDDYCKEKPPGTYCDANVAVLCGNAGDVVSTDNCTPAYCLDGTGCVACLTGMFDCQGNMVMQCNDAAVPPQWQQIQTCDPASGQGCDAVTGTCVMLQPIGGTEPTGVYYQFAEFTTGNSPYNGGYDVDSFDNKLYITSPQTIDVFEVELLDSDGDGVAEPNQHPNNPDEPGPIEERVLTFIESIPWPSYISQSQAELYALSDRIYMGGPNISMQMFGGAPASPIINLPPWQGSFALIGRDEVNGVWYAANESYRRVLQYDEPTASWGIAFYYPSLAGDHMDGMEVVTDPETGIPYVYVSDMTSDFIGQYRKDPWLGWVQENLFEYEGTAGSLVEGMGFGALNHFWATSGSAVYEIGGGDLGQYVEPPG